MVSSVYNVPLTGFKIELTESLKYMLGLTKVVVHPVVQKVMDAGVLGAALALIAYILYAATLP
jgi:hypothetical protein